MCDRERLERAAEHQRQLAVVVVLELFSEQRVDLQLLRLLLDRRQGRVFCVEETFVLVWDRFEKHRLVSERLLQRAELRGAVCGEQLRLGDASGDG